jgi:hypothetical protein
MQMTHAASVFSARTRLVAVALVAGCLASGFATAAVPAKPDGGEILDATVTAEAAIAPVDEVLAHSAFSVHAWAESAVDRIDPEVLRLALSASQCATTSGAVRDPATLTIIDYSKASVEPRMWVLDLRTRALLYEELVSHGQGSGGNHATRFSNTPESHQTSIGLFVTDQPYVGRNGYSLRLDGLDKGFNDRARERAIVMHGAPYVNADITKTLGRLGRSHGCPAVRDEVARELIDRVKDGSLVFAYYPDAEWLKSSKFLGNCGN